MKSLRLSFILIFALPAIACAIHSLKTDDPCDESDIPELLVQADWQIYWCPVHKQMLYIDHFLDNKKCYKKARRWHRKRHKHFITDDAYKLISGAGI